MVYVPVYEKLSQSVFGSIERALEYGLRKEFDNKDLPVRFDTRISPEEYVRQRLAG